jgi:hypothetical protein
MSTRLFIHNFFADGRADALLEVRILQRNAQWTKEKRASWIKEAVAYRERLYHTHPDIPEGRSYYAGRIAALKSRRAVSETSRDEHPTLPKGIIFYHPLPVHETRFCGCFDCGSEAIWGTSFQVDGPICLVLCDPCRQEWVRAETVSTEASGWDWGDDEDLFPDPPSPKRLSEVLRRKDFLHFGQIALPSVFLLGFDISNFFHPVSHSVMFAELFDVGLIALLTKPVLWVLLRALEIGEDS